MKILWTKKQEEEYRAEIRKELLAELIELKIKRTKKAGRPPKEPARQRKERAKSSLPK